MLFVFAVSSAEYKGQTDLLRLLKTVDKSATGLRNVGQMFRISGTPNLEDAADRYFSRIFFQDFGIAVFVRMESLPATIFSVMNPRGIMQLALTLDRIADSYTRLTVFYTPDSRNKQRSEVLATLYMSDITNKWTMFWIKLKGKVISLYQDCVEVDSEELTERHPLEVDRNSTIHIGSTGYSNSHHFEVSVSL